MTQPIRAILVYVDGSAQSFAAARLAVVLAHSFGAELHSLSVVNTRVLSDLVQAHIFLESEREEYRRDLEGDVERYMAKTQELGRRKGVIMQVHKAAGTVSMEIESLVKRLGIDLLILGEVAEIRSRRAELFGETERAARNVPCSVLVAKDEDRIGDLYDSI